MIPRQQHANVVVPPPNFSMVEKGLYRSAYPTDLRHIAFLRNCKIRTMVLLSLEGLPGPMLDAVTNASVPGSAGPSSLTGKSNIVASQAPPTRPLGMRLIHLRPKSVRGEPRTAPFDIMNMAQLQDAVDVMIDQSYHPLIVCCPTGEVESNIVVGCFRKLQRWALSAIFSEAELFVSSDHTLRPAVRQVIELWNTDGAEMYSLEKLHHRKQLREKDDRRQQSRTHVGSSRNGDASSIVSLRLLQQMIVRGSMLHSTSEPNAASQSAPKQPVAMSGSGCPMPPNGGPSSMTAMQMLGRDRSDSNSAGTVSPSLNSACTPRRDCDLDDMSLADDTDPVLLIDTVAWALTQPTVNMPDRIAPLMASKGTTPPLCGFPLAPHEKYWNMRNPPAIDARSAFNKNESLVEEDDD